MKEQTTLPLLSCRLKIDRRSPWAKEELIYDGSKESVLPIFRRFLRNVDREHHAVLTLDEAYTVTGFSVIGIGSLTEVSARTKEVFKVAVINNAAHVITCHTHPGRSAEPSEADRKSHRAMTEAGLALGIFLADELILASGGQSFSFSEEHSRNCRRKWKQERAQAVARSEKRIATGTSCARDVVLVAAELLASLPSMVRRDQLQHLGKLIADLDIIASTPQRIRKATRNRADQLLTLAREMLTVYENGGYFPTERMAALNVDLTPPQQQKNVPLVDFIESLTLYR